MKEESWAEEVALTPSLMSDEEEGGPTTLLLPKFASPRCNYTLLCIVLVHLAHTQRSSTINKTFFPGSLKGSQVYIPSST